MDTIFNTDNLPKRRLVVQMTIANRFAAGAGREISAMREKIARQLAQKCVECDDLVEIVADDLFLKVQADCIIMTQNELADLMRAQFKAGLEHARGFMTTCYPDKTP